MKLPPFLLGAVFGLLFPAALSAQNTLAKLIEPHDDAVTPEFLMEHAENGFAVVEAVIGPDSKFEFGYVIALSHGDLAKYAVDSAKNWKYTAGLFNGQPTRQKLDIPVFYKGDINMSDDQLSPLVQLARYVYNGWLATHGYRSFEDRLEARKAGLSGVTLLRRAQTDYLYADEDRTPKQMQEAVPFVNKLIAKTVFSDNVVALVQRMGQFTILLPTVKTKSQPAQ